MDANLKMDQLTFTELSGQLDQALAMEEHHREQLLWWRQRRQWLEDKIKLNDAFTELIEELFNDDEPETFQG